MSILKGLFFLVCVLCTTASGVAAAQAGLPADAQAIRTKVQQLSAGAKITVVPKNAPEEFGSLLSSAETTFRFHDVDTNLDIDFAYVDVKKIKNGYGGYTSVTGRHSARHGWLVFSCITVGLLVFLIAELAVSK